MGVKLTYDELLQQNQQLHHQVSQLNEHIASRKVIEEKLKMSEERYQSLYDTFLEIIYIHDFEGNFIDANPAALKRFGFKKSEVKSAKFSDFIDTEQLEKAKTVMNSLIDKGRQEDLVEYRVVNRNGEVIYLETNLSILYQNGQPYAIQTLARDITERKKAEHMLNLLKQSIDIASDAAFWVDIDGNFIYINNSACNSLGYSHNELITLNIRDIFEKPYSEKWYDLWEQIKQCGTLRKESVHVRKDGTSFPVEIISTFVNFEGWELICGFAQDITQRKLVENELLKAKEKAEESDRLKSAFLANMSHEIRTPMNAVVGFSSFLAKPNLTTEKRNHFISLIKERSLDLLRIIEDIIDISKIEVFQLKIFETEIVLSEFVNEIAELYKLKTSQGLSKTSVRLIFEIDENLKKAIIKTDNLRLKQVIYNLIDNALKFTREGSIEFSCMSTPDGYILFKVKDTGIGIPSNMHDVIFDRFRQVEDIHEARQYGGTGLGLSIVKGIISLLNGKVWLESKVGIGSTFFFTIPLKTGRNIDNKESKTKAKTLSWKGKTVLVVEDDVANAEFLNEILSELQLQVLNACNGAEALRIFKNNPHIDLVLMDILLPDINGLQLTRVFKKENPQMPVIAQTAYAGSNDLNECLAAGCSSCISKPIMYEQIKEVVGKFLNNDI